MTTHVNASVPIHLATDEPALYVDASAGVHPVQAGAVQTRWNFYRALTSGPKHPQSLAAANQATCFAHSYALWVTCYSVLPSILNGVLLHGCVQGRETVSFEGPPKTNRYRRYLQCRRRKEIVVRNAIQSAVANSGPNLTPSAMRFMNGLLR